MPIVSSTIPALWGVGGVLLGGGLTSIRDWSLRRAEARSVDAALTAEVKALLETIEARGFLRSLNRCLGEAERLVAAEQGETPLVFPQFSMTWDYFAVFEALRPKLGLLPAQRTSLITCFYVAAKSSCEMLIRRPEQPLAPVPARHLLPHLRMESALANRAIGLGHSIVGTVIVGTTGSAKA